MPDPHSTCLAEEVIVNPEDLALHAGVLHPLERHGAAGKGPDARSGQASYLGQRGRGLESRWVML
jgi:hypothetical protein